MKFFVFFMVLLLSQFVTWQISTSQVFSHGSFVTIKITDGIGQTDSVRIIVDTNATEGLDSSLGEINLYGIPLSDPEIRIIQRNIITSNYDKEYWLWSKNVKVKTFVSNIDLKNDYRPISFDMAERSLDFAVKINATYYPLTITFGNFTTYYPEVLLYCQFDDNNLGIDETDRPKDIFSWINIGDTLYVFEDSTQNHIIGFSPDLRVDVFEDIHPQGLIYPNPTQNLFNLEFDLTLNNNTVIDLVDLSGNIVKSIENQFLSVGHYTYNININDLPSGIYTLRILSGNYSFNKSIIKIK